MTLGVIYLLTNTINGKQYVGQTIDLNRRLAEHKSYSGIVIDKAIDKHGWDDFDLEILEDNVPIDELDREEIRYIAKRNTYAGSGYNLTKGGKVLRGKDAPFYGHHHTKRAKKKNSEAHKRENLSEETKAKMSRNHANFSGENHPMYGKHLTEKTKEKISKANKGKNNPMYDVHMTGEDAPRAKVTKNEGVKIQKEYKENEDTILKDLAEKYDTNQTTISEIVNGKHWTTKEENNNGR